MAERDPLNQILLEQLLRQADRTFDASLALEFLGFTGPEAKEGVAAFREKRKPQFPTHSPL
jgi:enoyl-CoA hydratase